MSEKNPGLLDIIDLFKKPRKNKAGPLHHAESSREESPAQFMSRSYGTWKQERDEYSFLREKSRRFGFHNLSPDEKERYSKMALVKGHPLEG